MARQRGIIRAHGSVGDITYHKSKDGWLMKERILPKGGSFRSNPAYQRVRENIAEFAIAAKTGGLIRAAFISLIKRGPDNRMISRLVKALYQVQQTDNVNTRGQRTPAAGNLEMLEGFEFNARAHLGVTFFEVPTITFDRATGEARVDYAPFSPGSQIRASAGATHFRLKVTATAIDFANLKFVSKDDMTEYMPLGELPTGAISLKATLPAGTTDPVFLGLGLEFAQEVNGLPYPLLNGTFNAIKIVKVEA